MGEVLDIEAQRALISESIMKSLESGELVINPAYIAAFSTPEVPVTAQVENDLSNGGVA